MGGVVGGMGIGDRDLQNAQVVQDADEKKDDRQDHKTERE